ncbi:MAG: DUF3857 domain-containing transglutaminase family protein [Hyphomonadaceae bacterium]
MEQIGATHREITPGARVAPPAAWVDVAQYPIPAEANPHFIAQGICVLLDDSQIDLCGPERSWYYRRAEMVTASAGAERAAQFSVSFDPAFERLEVHSVAVIRNGIRTEHAHTAFYEVLRRERNMERLQFDGRLTVHVTLPDVRAGDVVETSYTVTGMRKSLNNRHGAWIALEWGVGIVEVRIRQRSPKDRVIRELGLNDVPAPTVREENGVVEKRWRTFERPGVRFESLTPPWVVQSAALQLSEWRDWAEVADTFTPLYEDEGALPPDVEAEIERIAREEPTPAGRAAAILRFTQGTVRYLAISIGEGGFTPRRIADIDATRYGDCKDKSKLYVHMARRLGVDACAALVNTRDGYAIDTWLPSGVVFDHCIVRVALDGAVYWLDPTRSLQPSPLDTLSQCHFGWALPLRPGQSALERMPDPSPAHTQETFERVTLGKSPDHTVRYEWRITSRRGRAEWVREGIAREGAVGMFKLYAEDIARRFHGATPLRQEVTEDNARDNVLTALEVYEISDAWTKGEGKLRHITTHDLNMKGQLAPLDPGPRTHDIYLGQVGLVTRRVEIETAYNIRFKGWKRAVEASTVSFKNEFRKEGPRHFVLEQSLEFRSLTLPAAEAEQYRQIIQELNGSDVVFSAVVGRRGMFAGADETEQDDWSDRSGADWLWRLLPLGLLGAYWAWRYYEAGGWR